MNELVTEYLAIVDGIHGAYLDAVTGFALIVDEYDAARSRMQAARPQIPPDAYDGAPMVYGTGHPRQPQSRVVHACTQGEYRQRNAPAGSNHRVIGQMCIAQIFGYWEDGYRGRLADKAGRDRKDVGLDVMGDLRWLRNSIVHHRGIALKDVEKCKLLKWFREGDDMLISPEHFEQLIPVLRTDLRGWVANAARTPGPA